ncbi:MAG TPA: heparan-alpha-glucosaminide N-acetyltransferase domain-containing protein [Candidatus Acidoferrum sp.]|jgi:predicted acyltransferase|nr:heparan-alpha-glucosaminide N-acetyltransferase domain-containing protein [Candidatus Acidoferrum sp.]
MSATRTTVLTETSAASPKSASTTSDRLTSLDLFRGATIAAMILVNNPGNDHAYWPLEHAQWNGWTPTDLIFPFFLFIVGVSLVFSFQSRLNRGNSRALLLRHAFLRAIIIFAIGLALNYTVVLFSPSDGLRIPGVLQRIGICYLVASILFLYVGPKTRALVVVGLLVGYWILMRFVPVPGFGVPGRNIPLLHPDMNLAAYLDRKLLLWGTTSLYEVTRDPEGLLSTLPAIATALLGVFTGEWLRSKYSSQTKALGMLAAGVAGLILGEVWGIWFPINKKLWTSSYVLFAAGFALVCLSLCYWATDIKRWRGGWTRPFLIFGRNSITIYTFAWFFAICLYVFSGQLHGEKLNGHDYIVQRFFAPLGSPSFASLLFSLAFVLACLVPIWLMDRKKIFLKI